MPIPAERTTPGCQRAEPPIRQRRAPASPRGSGAGPQGPRERRAGAQGNARCPTVPEPPSANGEHPRAREAAERGLRAPASAEPGLGAEPHLQKDPPQKDDKPNSVPGSPPDGGSPSDDHSSSPAITDGIKQPTRRLRTGRPITPPYLVLLRAGFSLPFTLRQTRCALTAPFHPYPPTP